MYILKNNYNKVLYQVTARLLSCNHVSVTLTFPMDTVPLTLLRQSLPLLIFLLPSLPWCSLSPLLSHPSILSPLPFLPPLHPLFQPSYTLPFLLPHTRTQPALTGHRHQWIPNTHGQNSSRVLEGVLLPLSRVVSTGIPEQLQDVCIWTLPWLCSGVFLSSFSVYNSWSMLLFNAMLYALFTSRYDSKPLAIYILQKAGQVWGSV